MNEYEGHLRKKRISSSTYPRGQNRTSWDPCVMGGQASRDPTSARHRPRASGATTSRDPTTPRLTGPVRSSALSARLARHAGLTCHSPPPISPPLRLGPFPSPPRAPVPSVGRKWFSRESSRSRCPPRRPRPTAAYSCRLRSRRRLRVCAPCGPPPAVQRTPWRRFLWTRPRSLRAPQRSRPWASGMSCRRGTIR